MRLNLQTQTRRIPLRARRIREPGIVRFTIEWMVGGALGIILGLAILRLADAVPPSFRPVVDFVELQLF